MKMKMFTTFAALALTLSTSAAFAGPTRSNGTGHPSGFHDRTQPVHDHTTSAKR